MYAFVLALAIIIPFPLCLFRMKKYNISFAKMLVIYVLTSCIGASGAFIGSALAGGSIFGMRLYGLMIFDFVGMFLLSILLKINIGKLGDFVAPPLMAVCFSAKIACLVSDCCYGFVISQPQGQEPIRFPSVLFEMTLWLVFTVLLLVLEKSGKSKNALWPLTLIWFGIARYFADLLRGLEINQSATYGYEIYSG